MVKKYPLLFILAFCLTSFNHQAVYGKIDDHTTPTRGTLAKIATLITVWSISMYRGATLSTPTVKTFGGMENDQWLGIETTQDQGCITVGESFSYDIGGNSKGVMAKYDALGGQTWYASFGGTRSESIKDVGIIDHLYVMTGDTTSFGDISKDMLITVYDSTALSWITTQVTGGSSEEGGVAVATHDDGSYLVGGYTWQNGHADIILTRFYADHTEAWSRIIDGGSDDYVAAITAVTNGYVVVGYTTSGGAGGKDLLVFEINDLGNLGWANVLGGTGQEEGYAVVSTSSGDILITGYIQSLGTGQEDVLWVKLNSMGTLLSAQAIGFVGSEIGYGITLNANDYAFVTGSINSDGFGNKDMLILQIDDQELEEAFTLGGEYNDIGYDLTIDSNQYLTAIGSTFSGHGGQDMLFARLLTSDTATCRMDIVPTVIDITNSISWASISLNNNLSTLSTQSVTWQTYNLILQEGTICTPTSSPTSAPLDTTTLVPSEAPTVNAGPQIKVITIDPIDIEIGDNFLYPVGTFFQGDALTLSATKKGGDTLPGWLHLNATSNFFWGKPRDSDVGSYPIKLTATDTHGKSENLFFNINVRDSLADPGFQQADYLKIFAPLVAALVALVCGAYFCKKQQETQDTQMEILTKHHKKTDEDLEEENNIEFEEMRYNNKKTLGI